MNESKRKMDRKRRDGREKRDEKGKQVKKIISKKLQKENGEMRNKQEGVENQERGKRRRKQEIRGVRRA